MDYIREFDIRLEKEMYYAGEILTGHVILDTVENFKLRAIRVVLRGKAHTEWKVVVSGDRRTVKDDQYFIDDRTTIWGKEKAEGHVPILPRGMHQFPFRFQLPESALPCSFESRAGTIRYYIKVTVDIPYASPPQGMKYFTIIGPHIDCMDEQYLKPMVGQAKRATCCLCCERGPIVLKTQLERSAYVCGESLRVKADIDNQTEEEARLKLKFVQYVEYYIDRGVLGVTKEVSHTILEYRGPPVSPHSRFKWDSQQTLVVSTMPPTLLGVCRLMQIYYLLKVNVELEKSGEDLHMHFPITIATVPFRIPNSNQQPVIQYEVAADHVEGGLYIGPEFQLGEVYDGSPSAGDPIVLYRPVYLKCGTFSNEKSGVTTATTGNNSTDSGGGGCGGGGCGGGSASSSEPPKTDSNKVKENLKKFDLDILESKNKMMSTAGNKSGGGGGGHSIIKQPSFGFATSNLSTTTSDSKNQSSSTSASSDTKKLDSKDKSRQSAPPPPPPPPPSATTITAISKTTSDGSKETKSINPSGGGSSSKEEGSGGTKKVDTKL